MSGDAQKLVPVRARLFEETMDGYFPFRESVRQFMERMEFAAAWISLAHAPMMDLPDLAPDAPVPLRLRSGAAGTIRNMALVVVMGRDVSRLRGAARWEWFDAGREAGDVFDPGWRLAEPVFVRGIGFLRMRNGGEVVETSGFGALDRDAASPVALLRGLPEDVSPDARLWGVDAPDAILREETLPRPGVYGCLAGEVGGAGAMECLAVSLKDPEVARLAERIALDR